MAILSWQHLLDEAEKLIAPPPHGPPRQVDIRRAISAAYYAVFHFISTEVADMFVGRPNRRQPRYAFVYRSINHGHLKKVCVEVGKSRLSSAYRPYAPDNPLSNEIRSFCNLLPTLQEKRHNADYNPLLRVRTRDAKDAIKEARAAMEQFRDAPEDDRNFLLAVLLLPMRS